MPRDTYVRIGEAARLAGVSVDTLRRWERDGKLSAARTFGGQRTYSLANIERLRDTREPDDEDEGPHPQEHSQRAPATPPPVHPWKVREANAATDLSVTRLKIEQNEEIRRYREEEQRRAAAQRSAAEARVAEAHLAAKRDAERHRQQQALDSCLQLVRIHLFGEPSEARAEVERFLAEHAVPGKSVEWIKAECNAILDRRHAEREALAQRTRDEERQRAEETSRKASEAFRISELLAHADAFARKRTADRNEWDADAAEDAIEEVRDRLPEAVAPDWSNRRVEREVEAVLSEWDED